MTWPVVKLGDLVTVKGGGTPDKSVPGFWNGDVPWASVKDFKSHELSVTVDSITEAGVKASATQIIPAGNIIVPTRMAVGKVAINAVDMAINQDLKAIFVGPMIDRKYLLHALLANSGPLLAKATGATVKGIKVDVLKSLEIPLPPLEEQKRIAGILDQADALHRLRTRALEKLNTLGQAVFQEMFGDPQSNWPQVAISDVTKDARTGPFGSQLLVSEFVDSGIPVLGIDNVVQNKFLWAKERFITTQKYEQLKRYQVNPGDVLVTIMGTCGRCAVAPHDIGQAINTKHICCMTMQVEKIEPEFLRATLLWDACVLAQLGVEAKGAIMPGLNMGKIASLKFRLPPIEMQKIFIERIENIQADLIRVESATSKAEALFASLQSAAFQGKL